MKICTVYEAGIADIKGKVNRYADKGQKGVYVLFDENRKPLYVGKGTIRERVSIHLNNREIGHNYHFVRIIYMQNDSDIDQMEKVLIKALNPIFNITGRQNIIGGGYRRGEVYSSAYNKRTERYERSKGITPKEKPKVVDNGINEYYQKGYTLGASMGYDDGFDDGYDAGIKFAEEQIRLRNI